MMSEQMKEALYYGIRDIRLVQSPIPVIGPAEILVKVKKCAVCPTDVRKYNYENYTHLQIPTNLGHEWSGEIVEVGKNIKKFTIGMRVGGEGFFGYAEYGKVTEDLLRYLVHLPDTVSFEEATFLEPMADCLHALSKRGRLQIGETVLIVGSGPMGLQSVGIAKMMGAKVIVSELLPERRQLAKDFGADVVLDPKTGPIDEQIKVINSGKLVNVSLVSVSSPAAINTGIMSTGKLGRVILFGGGPKGTMVEIDPNWLHYNEISLVGSEWIGHEPEHDPILYQRALDIIASKKVPVGNLVSKHYPLDKVVEAIEAAAQPTTLKVIVDV